MKAGCTSSRSTRRVIFSWWRRIWSGGVVELALRRNRRSANAEYEKLRVIGRELIIQAKRIVRHGVGVDVFDCLAGKPVRVDQLCRRAPRSRFILAVINVVLA